MQFFHRKLLRQPNFFIIGAPKCGTTSLASWLKGHRNIYICPGKEPHFFNKDLRHRNTFTRKSYEALFKGANEKHIAIGEASVYYLFSQTAVPSIEQEISNARYIVMLRNPVDMAYSLHGQRLYSGNEHIENFEQAWDLSPERRKGGGVKQGCREAKLSDYQSVCSLGRQIQRLYNVVPRERVHVTVLDDMKENPRHEYLKVLDFLGTPDDGRTAFPVKNPAKATRWLWGHTAVLLLARASRTTKRVLGISLSRKTGVLDWIDGMNCKSQPRSSMTPELRGRVRDYFRDDIFLLGHLLDRDLSGWLK